VKIRRKKTNTNAPYQLLLPGKGKATSILPSLLAITINLRALLLSSAARLPFLSAPLLSPASAPTIRVRKPTPGAAKGIPGFEKGIFRSRAGNFRCWPRSSRYQLSTVKEFQVSGSSFQVPATEFKESRVNQGISGPGQFISGSGQGIPGVESRPKKFQVSGQVISGVNC
jgi:hypothetical protein